jgi:hypothetical protein
MSREELDDAEVEAIWEDAADAALHAWGPLGAPNCRPNPHPSGSTKADIWDGAFRDAYARENGR